MRRKNFVLTVAAAAVLGAFNPAFAQDSRDLTVNANPNVGANISPGVNVGSGDQSVSSSVSANQSSTDINSSSTMNQSTASGQASGSISAQASTSSDDPGRGHARRHDEDRAKVLDRADQVAGDHGKHGRDNAREMQGLN